MEEEKKVQPTSEPSPKKEDEVTTADITGDGSNPDSHVNEDENGKKGEGTSKTEEGGTPDPKPQQDRETDSKNAERRRKQKEREEQRQKEREAEIRRQAVFEVESGQVTEAELKELSLPKVETEDQLFLVKALRKAKAEGVENPQAEAYRSLFQKQTSEREQANAEAKAKAEAEAKQKEIVYKDQQAFKARFGKTTAEALQEEEFKEIFGGLIDPDKGNFTELYAAYEKMKSSRREEAKREGAVPTSASGSPSSNQGKRPERTREEFEAYWKSKYNS